MLLFASCYLSAIIGAVIFGLAAPASVGPYGGLLIGWGVGIVAAIVYAIFRR